MYAQQKNAYHLVVQQAATEEATTAGSVRGSLGHEAPARPTTATETLPLESAHLQALNGP